MPREALEALEALGAAPDPSARAVTSDLSIDEALLLHAAGWEPVDLATGVAVWSMPYGTFFLPYGQNDPVELGGASQATLEAFRAAGERLREDCHRSAGVGVVGVGVEVDIGSTSVKVAFNGTAVRRIEDSHPHPGRAFVTDLSTKDFVLLERAGWEPVDLAYGASFVAAPYQRLRQVVAQTAQNIELTNLTQALQDARELAMERMQTRRVRAGGCRRCRRLDPRRTARARPPHPRIHLLGHGGAACGGKAPAHRTRARAPPERRHARVRSDFTALVAERLKSRAPLLLRQQELGLRASRIRRIRPRMNADQACAALKDRAVGVETFDNSEELFVIGEASHSESSPHVIAKPPAPWVSGAGPAASFTLRHRIATVAAWQTAPASRSSSRVDDAPIRALSPPTAA